MHRTLLGTEGATSSGQTAKYLKFGARESGAAEAISLAAKDIVFSVHVAVILRVIPKLNSRAGQEGPVSYPLQLPAAELRLKSESVSVHHLGKLWA